MRRAMAMAALSAALVVIGCGDSDEDTNGTAAEGDSEPLSKEEYIQQADQICAEPADAVREGQADFEAAIERRDAQGAADALQQTADATTSTLSEFKALEPPAADRQQIDEIVANLDERRGLTEQLADALRAEDVAGQDAALTELQAEIERGSALAEEYGFQSCGRQG